MKRANFTLFQPQRWMSKIGQSALMVLFVWCMGANAALAQEEVKMPSDSSSVVEKIETCTGEPSTSSPFQFLDDGLADGNYSDVDTKSGASFPGVRADSVTFCPQDAWHAVKVTFTDFDIAADDSLFVYEGNRDSVRTGGATNLGYANGSGVSRFILRDPVSGAPNGNNGAGWVSASCSPADNPEGCLTFVFKTSNTQSKGKGWDAWVDCFDRAAKLSFDFNNDGDENDNGETIDDLNLVCGAFRSVGFLPVPTVELCGEVAAPGSPEAGIRVKVTNQSGEECINQDIFFPGAFQVFVGLDPGIYTVTYASIVDTTKFRTERFAVSLPTLICNDELNIPLGSACALTVTPDDVLENPCEGQFLPFIPVTAYDITITLGSGKNAVTKETTIEFTGDTDDFDDIFDPNLWEVTYPTITAEDVAAAGLMPCNASATVTIERIVNIYREVVDDGVVFMGACFGNTTTRTTCTSIINLSDQTGPSILLDIASDTLVACDTTGLASVLGATAIDNCTDDIDVTYTVVFATNDPCLGNDTTTATVNFRAVDACGNVGTASRDFTIIRPNEEHYADAPTPEPRSCKDGDDDSEMPGLKIGVLNNGEFEVKDTIELDTEDYICGYILTKRDVEIPSTDCGRKIFRYWSIIDWCDSGSGPSPIDTTFIEYTDTDAPEFQGEVEDQVIAPADIELGPFECTYDITKYPMPVATDECDDDVDVTLHRVFRIEDGEPWEVPASQWATLDCDSFRLMYIAQDQCHEQVINDTTRQIVVIKDVTKPSAICTDQLNVSVPSNSGARIEAKDIDAGSFDACGIDKIEIRRKDSGDDWAPYVDIVCEDVHSDLRIEMRVTDKKGNENICWMTVIAEDKIPPVCGDLPDLPFTCNDFTTGELGGDTGGGFIELTGDLLDLYNERFGDPATVCEDNLKCGIVGITQFYKLTEGNCGELTIERKWYAEDWQPEDGNRSNDGEQTITVTYAPDWKLTFPVDEELTCGGEFPAAATAADIVTNGSCDLWALEVTEKTFEVPGEICMKVERTYELINWCVYEAGTPAQVISRINDGREEAMVTAEGFENVGRFTYVQILKLYSADAPDIELAPVEECIYGVGDEVPFGAADNTPGFTPFECDTIRTFSASGTNCAGFELNSSSFTWKIYLNGDELDSGNGSTFDYPVTPNNKYKVEFTVEDGCGNSTSESMEVEFKDCKKPTPYVLHGIAVELMQTGMVAVWAKDLDQGSYDNCTPKSKLDLRIYHQNLGVDEPTTLAEVQALPTQITFGCADLTFGTQAVSIYVIDESGNWDYVSTYVSVQDNMGVCQPNNDDMGVIGGKITNPIGESVELVNVSVNGGENTSATGAAGTFEFSLPLAGDYTITPEKDINHLNGVSTYDLVLISKHILGIETFDSPYKYIAADVNKSGSITAFDMVQLRQLILNITSEFPNNASWRFVDAKYNFTSDNPAAEDFNEFMSVNNLDGQMMNVDFVATKIGDVNGNATANSLLGAESRSTNGSLNLVANDRLVEAGETVTVDFVATNIAAAQGYQFTLDFAGLNLVDLTEGVAKAANFNTNLAERGMLTTSWNGEATDENLFSVTFTANNSGLLSEMIAISSAITPAEAYNTNGELLDVNLTFNANSVAADFKLEQNSPNPFNGETVIGFNLPAAGKATLTVMDVQGKVLTVIERDADKGYNQVTVNAKTLGATGVLYYQLESADNIATKKMIILE